MFFDHLPQQGFICGHRGARSIAPENTLLAMVKARECGAHCWETDVRMSRDGELIVFHDDTLERTTDIATYAAFQDRVDLHVDRFTLGELRQLDAGSWFLAADPFGTVASGEVESGEEKLIRGQKIPLLREVLDFSREHAFPVNIEIKDLKTVPGDSLIVDKIIEMLRETDTIDLVLLSSFRHEYLHQVRALNKDIAIAVLTRKHHPSDIINYLHGFSASAYHPNVIDISDEKFISRIQRGGFRVNSWTVNDMEQAPKLLRMGVGVITDWPQRVMCEAYC